MPKTIEPDSEHTFNMNDPNRCYTISPTFPGGASTYVAICSCGERLTSGDEMGIAREMANHVSQEAGKRR